MPDIRFDPFPVLRDSPMMKRMLKRRQAAVPGRGADLFITKPQPLDGFKSIITTDIMRELDFRAMHHHEPKGWL